MYQLGAKTQDTGWCSLKLADGGAYSDGWNGLWGRRSDAARCWRRLGFACVLEAAERYLITLATF